MPQPKTKTRPKKPIRTAKQTRSKATVEVIVEAATRILSDHGWAALNTNAIAKRAGVSVGSVYEYFPNKHAIIDVILDRHLSEGEQVIAEGANRIEEMPSADRVVEILIDGFVGLHSDDPKLHRALSSDVPLTAAQKARVDELRDKIISLTRAALLDKVADANMAATLLVDAADALTHRWLVDDVGSPVPAETLSAELKKMLRLYVQTR